MLTMCAMLTMSYSVPVLHLIMAVLGKEFHPQLTEILSFLTNQKLKLMSYSPMTLCKNNI